MKDNILKSWRTTLIGLVIIGVYLYTSLVGDNGFDFTNLRQLPSILVAAGFIVAKDGNTSHSRNSSTEIVEGPDPKKEEK